MDYNSIHTGAEIDKAVGDVPLKLAKTEYFGNRNILIDGEVGRINQSNFNGTWANVIIGKYGYDIWMKESDTTIKQIVEEGNFAPGAEYTLSGTGVTEQQITSPASGNWVVGGIPNTATLVQVERGAISTEFEILPYSDQLARVQRYYLLNNKCSGSSTTALIGGQYWQGTAKTPTVIISELRRLDGVTRTGTPVAEYIGPTGFMRISGMNGLNAGEAYRYEITVDARL